MCVGQTTRQFNNGSTRQMHAIPATDYQRNGDTVTNGRGTSVKSIRDFVATALLSRQQVGFGKRPLTKSALPGVVGHRDLLGQPRSFIFHIVF
jgi:hypothetical protein